MNPSSIHHPTQLNPIIHIQEVTTEKTELSETRGIMKGSSGKDHRIEINLQEQSDSQIGLTARSVKHKGTETLSSTNHEGSLEMSDLSERPNLRRIKLDSGQSTGHSSLPLRTNTTVVSQLEGKPPEEPSIEHEEVSRSTVRRLIDSDDEGGDDDVLSVLSEDDVDQLQGEPIEEPPIEGDLDRGAGLGEGIENREGGRQVEGENHLEGGPRQVQGGVEMGLERADGFRVGENQINDIGQRQDINSDRTIPPQKILREAIAKAKEQPGFENASVKVKSSLDQELRSDNPNFKVETEVNMHGVLLYKVSVDFNVEIKNEDGKVITMTLNRVFYSNAANEKEALLAIYNVAKGVKQQATADNISENALEQKLFTVTYSRDPQSKSIIGVRSVVGDRDVDATPRSSGKTTFGRDIDAQGQVRLRRAGQGELEQGQALSKQARLLRSNIEFTDVPILDRLKRKKTEHKSYIDSQAYQANNLNEEFSLLKEQLLKDDLLKWIATNKKTFNTQVDNILSGNANPRELPLSEKMQEYLSLRQEYVKVQPLVEEFKINEAMNEGLKEIREKLSADKPLTPEDLAFIKGAKSKMGVELESPSDLTALSVLINGVDVKQNALRQQVGSQNPAGKLAELEGAYAEARVAALKEHQGLFANLGRMQDIQNELMDRKSKLEELRDGIENMADMPRPEAQMKMALIDEALGKIEAQIKDNAKVLNVESHLGKLFDQEIVIPPSVQRTGVSSDPDIVGQDAPA